MILKRHRPSSPVHLPHSPHPIIAPAHPVLHVKSPIPSSRSAPWVGVRWKDSHVVELSQVIWGVLWIIAVERDGVDLERDQPEASSPFWTVCSSVREYDYRDQMNSNREVWIDVTRACSVRSSTWRENVNDTSLCTKKIWKKKLQ